MKSRSVQCCLIRNGTDQPHGSGRVPTELLELFSKRTAQVDDALTVKLAEFYALNGQDSTMWERLR